MTSGLTSFRQLQRVPVNTVPCLEGHQVQHSNSSKAPFTPNHLDMRADSLSLTQEECQLSTRTTRGCFSQLLLCDRDPEVAASSGMNTEFPSLEARPDFPAVNQMQARVSSHNMKGFSVPCGDPRKSPRSPPYLDRRPQFHLATRETQGVKCFKTR